MKKLIKLFLPLLVAILFISPSLTFAQKQVAAIDSLFYRGVSVYQNARYQKCIDVMSMLDELYPNHARFTGSILMQGKANYQLDNNLKAIKLFDQLIQDYPSSHYVDDAFYGLGQVYLKTGQSANAVSMFLKVVETGSDIELQKKAAVIASDILELQLSAPAMKALLNTLKTERSSATVTIKLARLEMDARHYQTAKFFLNKHLEEFPLGHYDVTIRQLLSQAEVLSQGQIRVGVILPLTGPTAEDGKLLLEGLQFAVAQLSEKNHHIKLIIEDSGGNIVQAVMAAQKLCGNLEVVAIIGELESDITTAIAGIAQECGVPVLAPTATMDHIAEIGDFIFQLAATYSVHATSVAKYAVVDLGLKNFAVFYPADTIGKTSRDAFVKVVEENGGNIVAEKYYFEGSSDWKNYIGEQLTSLRRQGLEQMVSDSLIHFIPKDEWEEVYEGDFGNIHYVDCDMDDLVDSTRVAVTAFDGIFMPVYNDEVMYVAPHYFKQNFTAIPLGGIYWNQESLLIENRDFAAQTDGMIFPGDSYIDPDFQLYFQLINQYRIAKKKTPGNLEILGYDIIRILTKLIDGKSVNRLQIRDSIMEQRRFRGVRGNIIFNAHGANSYVHLLRYRNQRILKIR
ncbi:penicillin-binding protein activator [bacterium]|nr:penicillin-binding protein activator [bacterium]